jgi:hypothetical protein
MQVPPFTVARQQLEKEVYLGNVGSSFHPPHTKVIIEEPRLKFLKIKKNDLALAFAVFFGLISLVNQ